MTFRAYDHVESVEYLQSGNVRVVAVLPYSSFEQIISLAENIIHASRFLNTRSRVSVNSRIKHYIINSELVKEQ